MRYALPRLILVIVLCFGKLSAVIFLDNNCQPGQQQMMINSSNANRSPWMAYLIHNGKYFCGGSLLNSHFVLTAAHCARPPNTFYARLGEYDASVTTDGQTYDFLVTGIFPEPWGQDIALLKLVARIISFTETIRPICIVLYQNVAEVQELLSVNDFTVTGWGQTSRDNETPANILQKISVSRINPSICGNPAGQICCENSDQFICHGDSGSPLTSEHRYNHVTSTVQYGVLSSGHEKCYDHAKYVDIVPYTTWITNTIIKNF